MKILQRLLHPQDGTRGEDLDESQNLSGEKRYANEKNNRLSKDRCNGFRSFESCLCQFGSLHK